MNLRRIGRDLFALGLLAVAVFVGMSLWSYDPADPPGTSVYPVHDVPQNLVGEPGALVAHYLTQALGCGSYVALLLLITSDFRLFSRRTYRDMPFRLLGILLSLAAVCIGAHQFLPDLQPIPVVGSGGFVGAWGAALLEHHFQPTGVMILLSSALFSGLLLSGDAALLRAVYVLAMAPVRLLNRLAFGAAAASDRDAGDETAQAPRKTELSKSADTDEDVDAEHEPAESEFEDEEYEDAEEDEDSEEDYEDAEDEEDEPEADEAQPRGRPFKVNPPVSAKSARDEVREQLEAGSTRTVQEDFEFPDLDLLKDPEDFPYELLAQKAQGAAATLEKTFREFGLNIRVVEIDTGPVITLFELELEAGLRLSKVTALADDIAIALRVPSVRVVASIPGKNTVGVEVPNERQVMVRLRELIESCPEAADKKRIPLFLGKDVNGRPLVVDLTKMPHLLIAGRTGTGKSVCLNALILSILLTRSPDQVKMLLIDPKMVELSPYKRVPHLMHPVITDMKKAEAVLAWAVDKMEERYDLLARTGVRHLDAYNRLGKSRVLDRLGLDPESEEAEQIPETMPCIVIIADEMADLMMTSGKDVEGHIIRLAQKSRAVGIHLVLATQKPTVDVVTGLIKSNLPARISFQVASRSDSRVVLDEMGAERLLGNGDMLYLAPGTSHLTRAQGTFIDDDEISEIIEFFGNLEPEYSTELAQLSASHAHKGDASALSSRDELYEQAIEVVIREGRGSVSLLQRALGIGYGRAARLVDYMAEDGIVGDYNGSQAREVLYTLEQWEALRSGAEDLADVAI